MKKAMLIQPMAGRNELEILKERNMMKDVMESNGYEVMETLFREKAPKDVNEGLYYLGKSIQAMSKADLVVLLPNWNKNKGCKIEYECAKAYGKETLEIQLY